MSGMQLRIRKTQIPYFISGVIIFTNRFNGVNINQYLKYIIAGIWALYYIAIVVSIPPKGLKRDVRRQIREHFRLMIEPFLVFGIYSVMIWIFNGTGTFGNFTRLLSTILYLAIAWGFASCGYYLYGSKSINILFYAGVTSYFLGSIIPLITSYGIQEIGRYLVSTVTGGNTTASYIMEVHDLTFAMGLFFLYYAFIEAKSEKGHTKRIFLTILLIVLGLKRIEILALAIAIFSYWIVLRRGKTMKGRSMFFFIVFSVLSFGYVFCIWSGLLASIANQFGINFMGRLGYYSYANEFYNFSPFYLGSGYTYFSRYWGNLYANGFRIDGYGIAASIHSDILVMYIELGFVVMLGWLYYCFRYKTVKLNQLYGVVVGEYYLLATIFMFILYFTDNTSTYFITQMIYYLIPLALVKKLTMNINLKNKW